MSSDDRARFLSSLRQTLAPVLRAQGFKGTGSSYRRYSDPVVQIVHIQGSRYGGQCCVNLGLHLNFLPTSLGAALDAAKFNEWECEFRRRLANDGESDHWWRYGSSVAEAAASAADLVELYQRRGTPYFHEWSEFPGRYTKLTLDQLSRGELEELPTPVSPARAALTMARIHAQLGDRRAARAFAEFGLANTGSAVTLRRWLTEVLNAQSVA